MKDDSGIEEAGNVTVKTGLRETILLFGANANQVPSFPKKSAVSTEKSIYRPVKSIVFVGAEFSINARNAHHPILV